MNDNYSDDAFYTSFREYGMICNLRNMNFIFDLTVINFKKKDNIKN